MNCKFDVRMRRMCRNRAAMVALGLLIAISAAAPAWGVEPSPEPVDVAKSIMSPVCPGRLIADCPSPESEQLREVIRRKVGEGKSKQQIIDYFVEVYGPEVLPTPPQKGFYLTAWYMPMALIICGGGIVFLLIRIWSRDGGGGDEGEVLPDEPKAPDYQKYARILDNELKDYN